MPVKDTDRPEFEAFHDLAFDSDGREVLVGLSYEETEWYLDILERDPSGKSLITKDEAQHRAALDDRHNAARLRILEAWDEARFNTGRGRKNWFKSDIKTPNMHPGAVAMGGKSSRRNDAA